MKSLYPIAGHDVYQFVMPVIKSNMYVLTHNGSALVIDPWVNEEAERLLRDAAVKNCVILLTHEHYDHISGVNRLRELFECRVICSKNCGELISDPRGNAAAYFAAIFLKRDVREREEIGALVDIRYRCEADEVYEGEMYMDWQGLSVLLKELPGHSRGGQVIRIAERYVFTGDNLVPGEKVITRLPGGSRREYETAALPYLRALPRESVIYPGHGEVGLFSAFITQNTELRPDFIK